MAEIKMCSLRSSSKGNATIVYTESTKILVDCGISGKVLCDAMCQAGLDPTQIDAMVITHEHSDHTKGVGVVARKYNIPIFATYGTWSAMQTSVGEIPDGCRRVIDSDTPFKIGDITINAFVIPHDAAEPVGYRFECEGYKTAVATDIGIMSEELFESIKGCHTVLLESNYDLFMLEAGTYPYELKCRIKGDKGHLCNDDAALTARDLAKNGTKKIILGHISPENNYPDLAFETTKLCLASNGIMLGRDAWLYVAKKDDIVMTDDI